MRNEKLQDASISSQSTLNKYLKIDMARTYGDTELGESDDVSDIIIGESGYSGMDGSLSEEQISKTIYFYN